MQRMLLGAVVLSFAQSCAPSPAKISPRIEIQETGGSTVKLIPTAGQLPYCQVFTVSDRGVVRELTMNPDHWALPCPAGQPVGGVIYRIPVEEGAVRIHVIFSDRRLDTDPVAMQVHDLAAQNPGFSAMDLRAAGVVMIETLQYTPSLEADGVTVVGSSPR